MTKQLLLAISFCISIQSLVAQDSTEAKKLRPKVLHAEPLYIDLIRDLGARRGEKEWNIGMGLTDQQNFDRYELLVEYEWAPIDRLGFEVEIPFSLYYRNSKNSSEKAPSNRVEGIKTAVQWSLLVSEKLQLTSALGYLNEIKFTDLDKVSTGPLLKGNVFNPFFVTAKRMGRSFHSLMYSGVEIYKPFGNGSIETSYSVNTSFHYMIPSTRNFIGIEFNKSWRKHDFDMTIRPQLRLGISESLMIGIVTGIPIKRENERFSSFVRLIYEPKHR